MASVLWCFNSMWTENIQMFKLDLEKAKEPKIKLPTSIGSLKKQESSRKTSAAAAAAGVGCHNLLQCMKVKSESEVAQWCPTLNHPMDCSLPGSSVHGISSRRGLTPRGSLECNPEIPAFPGEEN